MYSGVCRIACLHSLYTANPGQTSPASMELPFYVYILLCADQRYYVGCTSDRAKRIARHEKGLVTSTEERLPVTCVCTIGFQDKSKAFAFEKYLKSGSGRAFMGRHLL